MARCMTGCRVVRHDPLPAVIVLILVPPLSAAPSRPARPARDHTPSHQRGEILLISTQPITHSSSSITPPFPYVGLRYIIFFLDLIFTITYLFVCVSVCVCVCVRFLLSQQQHQHQHQHVETSTATTAAAAQKQTTKDV
ncbi:uncharacterized protein K452DRAFT_82506 [Aplosporella prunicola CBS 121167]|uniref:Uncharacterized protein n=1 Tax=Aplosporella prunicola CBS 121167 TaxID=1176127 RepID=A0A6A6B347_9PEZI|nr:uncharacterized protein K452DRAFT_102269 [Aplosporella prunicola CBS 121167]XP_033394355.1 uncharacterized protein K452DRAFT_82506 [Aplosporella prunicola CBS 121167]KAF2137556.1 hypothetical protein K452DRAFT_102269 [Aplosporella prunicola CBS 121167]KAF2138642.1 hypothetical protein K452DRAFT_82506 [Aplosporella prunicola CBS 121167]